MKILDICSWTQKKRMWNIINDKGNYLNKTYHKLQWLIIKIHDHKYLLGVKNWVNICFLEIFFDIRVSKQEMIVFILKWFTLFDEGEYILDLGNCLFVYMTKNNFQGVDTGSKLHEQSKLLRNLFCEG